MVSINNKGQLVIIIENVDKEKLTSSLINLIQQRNEEFSQDTESLYYILNLLKSLQTETEPTLKNELTEKL